jgi:glutathione S-transferase
MKIYGNPISTCTRKVLMALGEKQAAFEFVTLDFAKGEHKSPAHIARQPFGQMPSLEHGEFSMFESRAMMRYIDENFPGQALQPKDPRTRAHMNQWMCVESEDFTPGMMAVIYQEMFAPMMGGKTDTTKVEEGKKKLAPVLAVLDKHLSHGGPHIVGDTFSLADISFMPYVEYGMNTSAKDLLLSHTHFAAWWTRISERPTWQKVVAK